jgi:hypothetical protein
MYLLPKDIQYNNIEAEGCTAIMASLSDKTNIKTLGKLINVGIINGNRFYEAFQEKFQNMAQIIVA